MRRNATSGHRHSQGAADPGRSAGPDEVQRFRAFSATEFFDSSDSYLTRPTPTSIWPGQA